MMEKVTKLRATARERQKPDWPRLQGMIRELCERKGWIDAEGEPELWSLGTAAGQATRYYQWMRTAQPVVKPSANSLRDLAHVADQGPRRVPHLAQESRWLEAGGIIARTDGSRLSDAQHDVVADMAGLPADLQVQVYHLVHSYRQAWERGQQDTPQAANGH